MHTFEDVLNHFPFRHVDRSSISFSTSIDPNKEYHQFIGRILNFTEEGVGRKRRWKALLHDGKGVIELIWFQGGQYVAKNIDPSKQYLVAGKVGYFNMQPQISHPEIELYSPNQSVQAFVPRN
jgi:ATP-dependent DNA helicase RecG